MTETVLAIDLGTSAAKLLLVDRSGTVVARQRIAHRTFTPTHDAAEQNPQEWWRNIGKAARKVLTDVSGDQRVGAVAVTGQMHGLVMRDEHGTSVGNAVIWQDRRSAITLQSLRDELPHDHWAQSDERIAPGYQATSWHYLSRSDPARVASVAHILLPKDEIITRLTGTYVTDHSDAIGTGWYDSATGQWDATVCAAAGVDAAALSGIVAPGSVVGSLSEGAAKHLDLGEGILVVIAGGDAAVAAFGAGATIAGMPLVMLSTGTQVLEPTWSNEHVSTWPSANPSGLPPRLHVTTTVTGGNVIDWGNRIFGPPADEFERLPDAPVFLPYLIGERGHPAIPFGSGSFVGLRDQHDRVDLANAVVEGVALATADAYARNSGVTASEHPMLVGGGGVRNSAWLDATVRAFARPLQVISEPDLSAWGAARSAATALGWTDPFGNPNEWVPNLRTVSAHHPDGARAIARLQRFQVLAREMVRE